MSITRFFLNELISNWENEVVEFKKVMSSTYATSEIGKYFSALANEANLRNKESAWLIFGIDNKTRKIVGSDFKSDPSKLEEFKHSIRQTIEPRITFRNIHELQTESGRVLLFEIPSAPLGIPISSNGIYYGRAGESLISIGLDKQDAIRAQTGKDWTAQPIPNATIKKHIDPIALKKSREAFAKKHANRFAETDVLGWSDSTFLDRAKLTIEGHITRTTLLLLGKAEAAHFLSPHPAQLTWKLEGQERAYEHFGPPFILTTTEIYKKIRNIQIRILPQDELFQIEVAKYDQKILLEALHNCIAHQDYTRHGRVIVTEKPECLIFENVGTFFEGEPTDYISGNKTPTRYRNAFLVQAMAGLNMIDTMGYGIHEMFLGQARRYFPMPDYNLDESNTVKMTLHGNIGDPAYSRILIQKTDLPLEDIFALDRVQKGLPVDSSKLKNLHKKKLIEGRNPNCHVSASIASVTEKKAEYIKTRSQDDAFYIKLIGDYLSKFRTATREELATLLWNKLSDGFNESQKNNKINNLIAKMRQDGRIHNVASSRKKSRWEHQKKL